MKVSITFLLINILVAFTLFFFNDPAPTEIYTLSLHDALPISIRAARSRSLQAPRHKQRPRSTADLQAGALARQLEGRSEEHTSELQSQSNLVCRLLLEKKNKQLATLKHANFCIFT